MPIQFQYGTPSMYAQAAQMVGEAQAARQTQAIALEKQRQTADIAMLQFREQLSIQAEQRSQQWELQKMEMRSQSDFALEERKRQIFAERDLQKEMKLQDEVEAGIKIIQESKHLSDKQKPIEIYRFKMNMLGYTPPKSDKFDLSQFGDNDLTPEPLEEEKPRGIVSGIKGLLGIKSKIPTGRGFATPFGDTVVQREPVVQSAMRLTDSDKEKLQTLDATSRKELETILSSGNTQLIQAALTRIRNL